MQWATDESENEVVKISIQCHSKYVAAAVAAISSALQSSGSDDKTVKQVLLVTREICHEAISQRNEDDRAIPLDIMLVERPDTMIIRIDDRGPPWSAGSFDTDAGSRLGTLLSASPTDAFHVFNRGRDGNRAELVLQRSGSADDVRSELKLADHEARLGAPDVGKDAPVEIRPMEKRDAVGVARAIYYCYGYSYDADWVYQPATIAQMLDAGTLYSIVGVAPDGEVVGHIGLIRPSHDSKVGESGQAVVDPRYRGHHLLKSLKKALADWAHEAGLRGLFSEATAAHPYSQRANIELGAHETGVLLGYIPNTVRYRNLQTTAEGHRRSVVLYYLKTNEAETRPVYAPARYRDIVAHIFAAGGLHGELRSHYGAVGTVDTTELDLELRRDHNQGIITVGRFGGDFVAAIETKQRQLCLHHVDCIYVDMPLSDPSTGALGGGLAALGFLFGGVFPNRRGDGDVLRLQYLNNVEIASEDITVNSELGQAIREFVLSSGSGS